MNVKLEFDPEMPNDTLTAMACQLDMLAAMFSAIGPQGLDLNPTAAAGLVDLLHSMSEAAAQVEEAMRPARRAA